MCSLFFMFYDHINLYQRLYLNILTPPLKVLLLDIQVCEQMTDLPRDLRKKFLNSSVSSVSSFDLNMRHGHENQLHTFYEYYTIYIFI